MDCPSFNTLHRTSKKSSGSPQQNPILGTRVPVEQPSTTSATDTRLAPPYRNNPS
jgi:hypothetical protein